MPNLTPSPVLQKIEIARKNESTHLDLSFCFLTSIPPEIFSLYQLESLDVRSNFIQYIPIEMMSLRKLRLIDLRDNPVQQAHNVHGVIIDYSVYCKLENSISKYVTGLKFNAENIVRISDVSRFPHISVLDLSHCRLAGIPTCVQSLHNISHLDLSYNNFNCFPTEICTLSNLEHLNLSNNRIGEIPKSILNVSNLTHFDISNNFVFGALPDFFSQLEDLKVLNLARNNIVIEPKYLSPIKHLESLDISANQFNDNMIYLLELKRLKKLGLAKIKVDTCPDFLKWFKNLQTLDLSNNYFGKLPDIWNELENLSALNISFNALSYLPDSFSALKNLSKIILTGNLFRSFPHQISNAKKMLYLDISNNRIRTLSDSKLSFPQINSFSMSSNQLTEFPEQLIEMTTLNLVNLAQNNISTIPESIAKLANLSSLNISNNPLINLFKSISKNKNLVSLRIAGLNINNIDPEIIQLKKLVYFDASNNNIRQIPDDLFELTNLRSILLLHNLIAEIPPKIIQATSIMKFDLTGNNTISKPPMEIAQKGIDAIRDYFIRINMEGVVHLNEAKIIIVGSPEVGKTTLANKIKDPSYVLKPQEEGTKGINIVKWNCSTSEKEIIHVGIWDFGGQQLYYSTHAFFLTKRSLYILVIDSRNEDTSYSYWLNIIRMVSEQSPMIIVYNEKSDIKSDISEEDLRNQYPNIIAVYSTNLATNRGLSDMITGIVNALVNLKHMGDLLPKSWIMVKNRLRSETREFIEFREFQKICSLCGIGIDNKEECRRISSYLHDLGVCFHYQADPLLAQKIIMKPEWCTDAVYKLLNSPLVKDNNGFFTDSLASKIWNETKFAENQKELINLMIEFKLCFRLRDSRGKYIAPHLLSPKKPHYNWDNSDNFKLKFEYEFMPPGLISKLIADMNEYIENKKLIWKSGVILKKENARAEITENTNLRFISIKLYGAEKKELFGAVDFILDGIHSSYKELKVRKKISCCCPTCSNYEEPFYFDYLKVKEQLFEGIKTGHCEKKPYHDVDLLKLIGQYEHHPVKQEQLKDDVPATNESEIPVTTKSKIFIVHGHDSSAKSEVARFIEKLDLEAIILHEQPNDGSTIIEKIEENTDVGYAVVLYTPCDVGSKSTDSGNLKSRARQNVVFEHGFLISKLGRKRVGAIVKGDVETPSDIDGIVYLKMDEFGGWQMALAKELKKSDFEVNLNKLLN